MKVEGLGFRTEGLGLRVLGSGLRGISRGRRLGLLGLRDERGFRNMRASKRNTKDILIWGIFNLKPHPVRQNFRILHSLEGKQRSARNEEEQVLYIYRYMYTYVYIHARNTHI